MKTYNTATHIIIAKCYGSIFQHICEETFSQCANHSDLMQQYNKLYHIIQSMNKKNLQKNLEQLVLIIEPLTDEDIDMPIPVPFFKIPEIKQAGIIALYKSECSDALLSEFNFWLDQLAQLN